MPGKIRRILFVPIDQESIDMNVLLFFALLLGSCSYIRAELLSSDDKKWIEESIQIYENENTMKKIVNFDALYGENPLDTLGHEDIRVKTELELNNGDFWNESVIITRLPGSPSRQRMVNNTGIFTTDVMVYEHVIPKLDFLMSEFNDKSQRPWAEYFGRKDDLSAFLREDVESLGFMKVDRLKGLDTKHCKLALATLAKFHAMTAVLYERNDIKNEIFYQQSLEKYFDPLKKFYQEIYTDLANYIEEHFGDEWQEAATRLHTKAKTVTEEMREILKRDKNRFNVLNHGSYSIKALLFAYGVSDVYQSQDPIAARMMTFQFANINSPALDLQYFMYTSPEINIMINERTQLIKAYHSALQKFLVKFDYKGKAPTFQDITDDVERFELVGLSNAINRLTNIYMTEEQAKKLRDDIEKVSKGPDRTKYAKLGYSDLYLRNMKKILSRAMSKKII